MKLKQALLRIINSPLVRVFIKNSYWSFLGTFLSKGINIFCIILIAKILGPKIFGEYNVVQTTVGMFGTFASIGLGLAATKLVAELIRANFSKIGELIGALYILSLIVSVFVSVLFFLFSSKIAFSLQNNSGLTLLFQITSVVVIFDSINGVQNGVLSGFQNFKLLSFLNILLGFLTFPLLLLGTYKNGIIGLTVMLLLTRFITVIICELYIRKYCRNKNVSIKFVFKGSQYKEILKIGIPTFFGAMTQSPINWVANFLMVNQPNGFQSLGVYNATNQLRNFVLFLPDSVGRISVPMLSNAYSAHEISKFKKIALLTFVWNFFLSVSPAIFLIVFSGVFKQILGVQYDFGINLIVIILITGIIMALTNSIGYIYVSSNYMWYDFGLRIASGISFIFLIFIYGRYNGTLGYAISVLGSILFYLSLQLLFLLKIQKSIRQHIQ